ncbi:hypothetical protein BD289DRAFT_423702 [Coniella lustricola]|uniref:N-acetyltransferase domain-containing protein n=1 Tax=Coniella lustricola TaxID=2025994 RepID=A0A2T3AJE3_9PEZI|nr:hypothetical protein BD289DRAFT_423702 [Coniella lustricola]
MSTMSTIQPPPFHRSSYTITSPRLTIRTAQESDTIALMKHLQTPENFPWPCEQDITPEKLSQRLGRWQAMQSRGETAFLIMTLNETGELLGQASYNCFEQVEVATPMSAFETQAATSEKGKSNEAKKKVLLTDLGITLEHSHWRKGLGTEAYCSLMEFAIVELGVRLFRCETGENNEAWKTTMRKLGLGRFEEFGPISFNDKLKGWRWRYSAEDWAVIKEELKESERWPLPL